MAHFTIAEMIQSHTAERLKINNDPSPVVRVHLTETITLLESIRAEWEEYCEVHNFGDPSIRISSGYRSAELNKAVGGVKNSAHVCGYAADLRISLLLSFPTWAMRMIRLLLRSRRLPDGCTWLTSVPMDGSVDSVSL